jgi:hypothetical protein
MDPVANFKMPVFYCCLHSLATSNKKIRTDKPKGAYSLARDAVPGHQYNSEKLQRGRNQDTGITS